MSFSEELKRRNVPRVAIAYLAAAWLLVQVVETLFPVFGFTDAHIRIVVVLLAIGFPLVLLFSWVYELTPEGLQLERDVDRSRPSTRRAEKNLDRTIIVVLTLAIGYFSIDKFMLDPARDAELQQLAEQKGRSEALSKSTSQNLIAVLPFVNISRDDRDEYFSDGVSEELLTQLAHVPRLQVISRRSSFSFKGKDVTIPEIAERLNAAYVVDGTVRRDGNEFRIAVQLIDAHSDTPLWSQIYKPSADEIFSTYDEISAAIVDALRVPLDLGVSAVPRDTTSVNIAAHQAFLRGRYLASQSTPNSLVNAVRELERAVELDPNFALGHAELAITLMKADSHLLTESSDLSWEDLYTRIERHVDRAMALDPGLAESQAARGRLLWNLDRFDEKALAYYRRAVEINPSYADGWEWIAGQFELVSFAESFAAVETAARLDPLSRPANWEYIHMLIRRDRLSEADRQIEKYALIDPLGATILRGYRNSIDGHWSNRILALLEALSHGKDDVLWGGEMANLPAQLAMIGLEEECLLLADGKDLLELGFLGEPGEAIALARAKLADDPRSVSPFVMGLILAHAGYYGDALPYLEEVWQQWGERLVLDNEMNATFAEALFAARSAAGDKAGAEQVIVALWDNVRRFRDQHGYRTDWVHSVDYQEGIAAYLSGDRYKGIALIAKAAEEGYWISEAPSAFREAMYQEPEFQLIFERQAARQARERKKVLEVVCNENPYAAVWQPVTETCKKIASSFNAGSR